MSAESYIVMSKNRWTLSVVLLLMSLICGVSVWRLGAANPTSGTISLSSPPVSWTGTAAGGTYNGESTCVEGINCDTFTLTVTGTPAQWAGKRIQVAMSWVVLANDYDLYIHKGDNTGPVRQSVGSWRTFDQRNCLYRSGQSGLGWLYHFYRSRRLFYRISRGSISLPGNGRSGISAASTGTGSIDELED